MAGGLARIESGPISATIQASSEQDRALGAQIFGYPSEIAPIVVAGPGFFLYDLEQQANPNIPQCIAENLRLEGYAEGVDSRPIDWHVTELRRKLETDPAAPRYRLTVRKTGCRLVGSPHPVG